MSVYTNPATSAGDHATAYIEAVLALVGEQDPLTILGELPGFLHEAVEGLSAEQLRRPEAEGKWSMIQIIQHLADSELVWAYQIRTVLTQDRAPITGYDQDEWAARLHYTEAPLDETLQLVAALRTANLRLLRSLDPEERSRVGLHEERGEESLDHMVRLYAGHDLVHRSQLERVAAGVNSG